MLDQTAMLDELKKINNFLLNNTMMEGKTHFHKMHSLKHQNIIRRLSYDDAFDVPPVFSECAIRIMEDFYRNDISDIDVIMKNLRDYSFKDENFYIYFYWVLVNKANDIDKIIIKNSVDSCPDLRKKILDSMNKDSSEKFLNRPVEFFEQDNHQWLTPFFYYYEALFDNTAPAWMQVDYILKLIVVPDPHKTGLIISTNISLGWFEDKFPDVTPTQIIEFGLKIIESVKNVFSRTQIIKYFINYYKSNEKNMLTEKILGFIIDSTQKLFNVTFGDHISRVCL
jgi:hypothetical protein